MRYDTNTETLDISFGGMYLLAEYIDETIRRCDLPQDGYGYNLPQGWQPPETCRLLGNIVRAYLRTTLVTQGGATYNYMMETLRRLDAACGDCNK